AAHVSGRVNETQRRKRGPMTDDITASSEQTAPATSDQTASQVVPIPQTSTPHTNGEADLPAWLTLLVYGGAAVMFAAWQYEPTRNFVQNSWPLMVIGLFVFVVIVLALRPALRTEQKRVAFVIFVVVPIVVLALAAVPLLLDPRYHVTV